MSLQTNHSIPVPATTDDEIYVGTAVFHIFVHKQFRQQGLSDDPIIDEELGHILIDHLAMSQDSSKPAATASNTNDVSAVVKGADKPVVVAEDADEPIVNIGESSDFRILNSKLGVQLDDISEEFAKSRYRKKIKYLANQVKLSQITFKRFRELLEGVFKKSINQYNIIALFFFCSDILIRAVESELFEIGKHLFKWALQYIVEIVCTWIHDQGGWEIVFRKFGRFKNIGVYCGVAVVVVFCGFGLYRILRK